MGETSPLFVCGKEANMKESEVLIETINPCGGEKHADKKLIEVETNDPSAYVRENSPYPVRCAGMDKRLCQELCANLFSRSGRNLSRGAA